jgi:putative oxidoreductase
MSSTAAQAAWALTRFVFGAAMATFHGYGKVVEGKVGGLVNVATELGFPAPTFFAWAAALSEFVGGILVAVGLLTRPAAGFVAMTMVVALYRHRVDPLMKMELALLYLAVMILALALGGGRFSLDAAIRQRRQGPPPIFRTR